MKLSTSTAAKTALASSLAWWLAIWLWGPSKPYLAALAAILSLNLTVSQTLSRGMQRVFGVMGGIAVAFAIAAIWGMNAWTVGALVLVSLGLGRQLGIGELGTPQIAISGLMVWSMGHHRELDYALLRIGDTLVGAAVAVMINGLLHPADLSLAAQDSGKAVLRSLAISARDMARVLKTPRDLRLERVRARARSAERQMEDLRQKIDLADQSLRWNLWGASGRRRLTRIRWLAALLENTHTQIRSMARVIADLDESGWLLADPSLGRLMEQVAEVFEQTNRWLKTADHAPLVRALAEASDSLETCLQSMGLPHDWRQAQLASVLMTSGRFIDDVRKFLISAGQDP